MIHTDMLYIKRANSVQFTALLSALFAKARVLILKLSISSWGFVTICEKLIAADFILMIFMPQEQPGHKHLYTKIKSNSC